MRKAINIFICRLRTAEKFDMAAGEWRAVAEMRTRRSTFAACVLEDCIYAIGGYNGEKTLVPLSKISYSK